MATGKNRQRRRREPAEIVFVVMLAIAIVLATVANVEFGRRGGVLGSPGWVSYVVTAALLTLLVIAPTAITAIVTRKRGAASRQAAAGAEAAAPGQGQGQQPAEAGQQPAVPMPVQPEASLRSYLESLLQAENVTDAFMVKVACDGKREEAASGALNCLNAAEVDVRACFDFEDDALVFIVAEPDQAKIASALPAAAAIIPLN